jgi:hypothetical protein
MLFGRCLLENKQDFPFGELKSVVDFNKIQGLHMSKIYLLKKKQGMKQVYQLPFGNARASSIQS